MEMCTLAVAVSFPNGHFSFLFVTSPKVEIKSIEPIYFAHKREEILAMIWDMEEEIMGKDI